MRVSAGTERMNRVNREAGGLPTNRKVRANEHLGVNHGSHLGRSANTGQLSETIRSFRRSGSPPAPKSSKENFRKPPLLARSMAVRLPTHGRSH
jgi:hypothetical protein